MFGSKVVTRPLNPTVAVAAGSVQKNKKPFDIFIAAKHHYFSLFGILDTMPTLEDVLGESVGDGKHKEDWEIDSHGDDDDEDDEEFIIV